MTNPDGDPVCVNGSDDEDGDGIPNDKDFCMHLAGGAFDEDGDGIGDECDACPIARAPTTAETDGDGVDSPCDPDPRLGGAKIVLFEGFNAPLSASWKASGAAWQIANGSATITAAGLEELTIPITSSNKLEIFTDYRVTAAGATTAEVGIEAVNQLPMGRTTVRCGGQRAQTVDLIRLADSDSHPSNSNLFDSTARYGLLEQLDGGAANCAYNSTRYQDAIGGNTDGEAMNNAGLYAQGATISFNYILVVEH